VNLQDSSMGMFFSCGIWFRQMSLAAFSLGSVEAL
jgi:hypothetical protein